MGTPYSGARQIVSVMPKMNKTPPFLPVASAQSVDDEVDVVRYLDIIIANRRLIAAVTVFTVILATAYAFISKPVYEADILVQVEDNPTSASSLLGDVSSLFDVKTEAAAEIEIIRSRMVVGQAVENLKLYIDAKPKYFPLIGQRIAQKSKSLSSPGLFGFGGYSWGTESISVDIFDVPDDLEGEKFKLVSLGDSRYSIYQSDMTNPIEGSVGELIEAKQEVGTIKILVSKISANPGAEFQVIRKPKLKTLEDLQDDLQIVEKGKQSGIIGASLQGKDPEVTAAVMNQIGEEYVAQNVRRKAEEAEKSLAFLGGLMPQLKKDLERAEVAFNAMRDKRSTFDLSQEAKAYLQESVEAESGSLELQQKRAELLTRFTVQHPSVQAIDRQIGALQAKAGKISKQMKSLPNLEQDTVRLMRDVQVNNDLYVGVLNNMQQLRLVKAGKVGNVRVVDFARVPQEPVKPKKALIIAIAAFMGVLIGTIVAFARDALYRGITDPQDIEQHTGLSVYATVPLSLAQASLSDEIRTRRNGSYLLASRYPNEASIESLKSLRTALQFALLDSTNNRVLLTGPTPGVGKSFISANLAAVMAMGGKRVLLLDADMRKGHINQYFGKDRRPGLSDFLAGQVSLDKVIHSEVVSGLDFIATGTIPPNPAELVVTEKMTELLEMLSERYDLVLIDTPPVLAVSDTASIAGRCGSVFLVTRFEKTTIGEISESAKQLQHGNAPVRGVIFNGLDPNAFRYGYGSRYGRYRYAYYGYSPEFQTVESEAKVS